MTLEGRRNGENIRILNYWYEFTVKKKTKPKNNSTYFIYVWCNNELHSVQLNITMYGNKTHIKQEQL